MCSTIKAIALFATLLFGVGTSVAQEAQPAPSGRVFKDGEIVIKTEVSRSERATTVRIEPTFIEFSEQAKTSLFLTAAFIYAGDSPASAKLITLSFYSKSPTCKFPETIDFKLVLLIDGERATINAKPENIKKGRGGATSFSEIEGDICNESLTAYLPQKVFVKFAKAKEIKVRFGSMSFQLKENNLEALRNLAGLMVSSSATPNTPAPTPAG